MDDSIDLHYRLLERLEGLARLVLEGKLHSVQDIWQFEILYTLALLKRLRSAR